MLSEAAMAELMRQLAADEYSANLLHAAGLNWLTAVELVRQMRDGPDLAALRDYGLSQQHTVAISTAIYARAGRKRAEAEAAERARLRRAMVESHPDKGGAANDFISARAAYVESTPLKAESMDAASAVSAMHTLFQESGRGYPACIDKLREAGFSKEFAEELKRVADRTSDWNAISQMHTLFCEAESGRPVCLTTMTTDSWSIAFSRELKLVSDKTLAAQRAVAFIAFGNGRLK